MYRLHAVEQMFKRAMSPYEVEQVIAEGEEVAAYPTDKPYPSSLRLCVVNGRPIHVVVARNESGTCFVVTAYEPSIFIWNADFKTKKK
jgi:hypothetical protein